MDALINKNIGIFVQNRHKGLNSLIKILKKMEYRYGSWGNSSFKRVNITNDVLNVFDMEVQSDPLFSVAVEDNKLLPADMIKAKTFLLKLSSEYKTKANNIKIFENRESIAQSEFSMRVALAAKNCIGAYKLSKEHKACMSARISVERKRIKLWNKEIDIYLEENEVIKP